MKLQSILAASLTAMVVGGAHAQGVDANAAMALAQKNGCLACHSLDGKMVGPAWKDVGKKYAGDAEAEAKLVTKVRKGGKGVWGEVPMPPNVTVKEADVRTLVQYVLTLK
ncbi:MAG: c-type cytochrome [Methylibium sp.]